MQTYQVYHIISVRRSLGLTLSFFRVVIGRPEVRLYGPLRVLLLRGTIINTRVGPNIVGKNREIYRFLL